MDAAFHYRSRQPLEMEDLVTKFVENELGRLDWMHNWPAWKVKNPKYLDKIRSFFHLLGEDVDPQEVAQFIDKMIVTRPGRWR